MCYMLVYSFESYIFPLLQAGHVHSRELLQPRGPPQFSFNYIAPNHNNILEDKDHTTIQRKLQQLDDLLRRSNWQQWE